MQPTPILVIGDEDLFIEFMGRFSPRDNQLLFAADLHEALKHCQTSQPELFVLPLDRSGQELTSILTEAVRLDAQVLGLSFNGGDRLPDYVTRLVPVGDVEAAYTAAAELLEERRRWPRIRHQLAVAVDGMGTLRSVSISATSIFVASEAPLESGVEVTISIKVSDGELSGRARVMRVGIGEDGNLGMVLVVSPDSVTVRHFLESLVRQLLQHEHERQQEADDLPPAPVAPMDPLGEHQLSALNRALDVIVGEVASLRQQVEAGRRGDARLEALEAQAAEQQERLASQLEVIDRISGRLERLRQGRQSVAEALARRAEEAQAGTERFERLEASIEAAQKSAGYVEESRAGLKGRLERLEQGRADLDRTLESQGGELATHGSGLEALERWRTDLDKTLRSQGDQLMALGSGLEQVAEIAASSGLTLEEKKQEILQQVEQTLEAPRAQLAELSGRVDVAELAQEQVRDELRKGFEEQRGDLQHAAQAAAQAAAEQGDAAAGLADRVDGLEALTGEARTEAHEAREALGQQVELTRQALQALERSIGLQDGHIEALSGRMERQEALNERTEALEALGERTEELDERVASLEALGERVTSLEALGERVEALEALGERVTSLEALGERMAALEALGERVTSLEALGERVDELRALVGRVEGLTGQITEVQQTFDEVRDEVSDLMQAIATRVEEVAEAPAEELARLVKGLKAVGEQQEQLNRTLAEQNRVVVKLVQRLDRIES